MRTLDSLFDDAQVEANGLVQLINQPGLDAVSLLGSLFKLDGKTQQASRPAPGRGEHTNDVLRTLSSPSVGQEVTA